MYNRVADNAVQIHGGLDYPIEHFYCDARVTRIYEGTVRSGKISLPPNSRKTF